MSNAEAGVILAPLDDPGPQPFDALALGYDRKFSESPLGVALRAAVWRLALTRFEPGQKLMDLGCGTGCDALFLARQGMQVDAIDPSAGMLEQARRRLGMAQASGVRLFQASAETFDRQPGLAGPYDGLICNFGAINCVADLTGLGRRLAERMRPGASCLLVAMGPFCALELLGFGLRLDRRALRRFRPGGARLKMGGQPLRVHYPSPRRLARAMAPAFRPVGLWPLGLLLPPSDLCRGLDRRAAWLGRLGAADRIASRLPGAAWLSDHYILELRRSPCAAGELCS